MKRKVILIGIALALCVGLNKYQIDKSKVERLKELERTEEISQKLDVAPSWEAIVEHLDCDILVRGKAKQDVLTELQFIGDIDWREPGYSGDVTVFFNEDFIHAEIGEVALFFDENKQLSRKYRYYNLYDNRDMYCPYNQ